LKTSVDLCESFVDLYVIKRMIRTYTELVRGFTEVHREEENGIEYAEVHS